MVASPCTEMVAELRFPLSPPAQGPLLPGTLCLLALLLLHFTLRGQGSICLVTNEFLVPMHDVAFGRCSVNICAKKERPRCSACLPALGSSRGSPYIRQAAAPDFHLGAPVSGWQDGWGRGRGGGLAWKRVRQQMHFNACPRPQTPCGPRPRGTNGAGANDSFPHLRNKGGGGA